MRKLYIVCNKCDHLATTKGYGLFVCKCDEKYQLAYENSWSPFTNVDWELLRKQKRWLGSHIDRVEALGLLNFLDALMEYAVDQLGISSEEVFGKKIDGPCGPRKRSKKPLNE